MVKDNTHVKKAIALKDWQKRLAAADIKKSDLNRLVMNYLVIEGYKDAAERFMQEAGLDAERDLGSIEDRMQIRHAVQNGEVERAIELVNDLNPEILDTNPQLYFHLQQQRLIELIRDNRITEALDFAREELAPRGEENSGFLEELERTMALLAFEDQSASPMAYLLDPAQRQKTASELNAAILASQCQEKDPKLPLLIKMLRWSQEQLRDKVDYPTITNIVTATFDEPHAPHAHTS
eukprot:comp21000_c0_seq1/m.28167 comp21000_c0_seq1/g.28167  ORF comp21000_c0_seq1/g.28167 comp21000_c0_seq1/m.28167 type:complete len:237 (-) comp21000_c0_seq1:167-877(-)